MVNALKVGVNVVELTLVFVWVRHGRLSANGASYSRYNFYGVLIDTNFQVPKQDVLYQHKAHNQPM